MERDDFEDDADVADIGRSPADRMMMRAIATADSARTGVIALRVIAAVVATAAVIGYALNVMEYTVNDGEDGFFGGVSVPDRKQLAVFLAGVSTPLAFAGLLVAASYLLSVYSSRLEMDIVLADEETPESAGGAGG